MVRSGRDSAKQGEANSRRYPQAERQSEHPGARRPSGWRDMRRLLGTLLAIAVVLRLTRPYVGWLRTASADTAKLSGGYASDLHEAMTDGDCA